MREVIYDEIVRASATETGVLNLAIAKGLKAGQADKTADEISQTVLTIAKEHFGIEYELGTAQLKKEGEA